MAAAKKRTPAKKAAAPRSAAAKRSGQEAQNRASSGAPNRKSGKSTPASRAIRDVKKTVSNVLQYANPLYAAAKGAKEVISFQGTKGHQGRRYEQIKSAHKNYLYDEGSSMPYGSEGNRRARQKLQNSLPDKNLNTVPGALFAFSRDLVTPIGRVRRNNADRRAVQEAKNEVAKEKAEYRRTDIGGTRTRGSKAVKKK